MGSEFASDGYRGRSHFGSSSIYFVGLCWLLDFSVSGWLKISVANLQALLLAALAMVAIGAGAFLCS
jgi:hypothetical protein